MRCKYSIGPTAMIRYEAFSSKLKLTLKTCIMKLLRGLQKVSWEFGANF